MGGRAKRERGHNMGKVLAVGKGSTCLKGQNPQLLFSGCSNLLVGDAILRWEILGRVSLERVNQEFYFRQIENKNPLFKLSFL